MGVVLRLSKIHFLLLGIRTLIHFVYQTFYLISFFLSFFSVSRSDIHSNFFLTFIPVKIFTIRGECGYVCYCRNLSLILPSVELAGPKKNKKKMATAGLETGTSWTRD